MYQHIIDFECAFLIHRSKAAQRILFHIPNTGSSDHGLATKEAISTPTARVSG